MIGFILDKFRNTCGRCQGVLSAVKLATLVSHTRLNNDIYPLQQTAAFTFANTQIARWPKMIVVRNVLAVVTGHKLVKSASMADALGLIHFLYNRSSKLIQTNHLLIPTSSERCHLSAKLAKAECDRQLARLRRYHLDLASSNDQMHVLLATNDPAPPSA